MATTDVNANESSAKLTLRIEKLERLYELKGKDFHLNLNGTFDGVEVDGGNVEKFGPESAAGPFDSLVCIFDVGVGTAADVEKIANQPLTLSFGEIIKSEKKKNKDKQDQRVELVKGDIPLAELLEGKTAVTTTVILMSSEDTAVENAIPVTVTVLISLDKPLIDSSVLETSSLLTLNATVHSLPETKEFDAAGVPNVSYEISFPLPFENGKNIDFINGKIEAADDSEVVLLNKRKYSEVTNQSNPFAEENGAMTDSDSFAFRLTAETEKPIITWPRKEVRFLVDADSKSMCATIPKSRRLAIEVKRVTMEQAGGKTTKKGGKSTAPEFERVVRFHGVAIVDVAALLYPGTTSFSGAFPVVAYNEDKLEELLTGIPRQKPTNDDNDNNNTTTSQSLKAPAKKGSKKDATPLLVSNEHEVSEAAVYEEATTYINLTLNISRPLIAKKTREQVITTLNSLIKPRDVYPKNSGGAAKSVTDLHGHIGAVANQIMEEYRGQVAKSAQNSTSKEDVRRGLLYELNTSGKYFAYKEQLKRAIVKVVREKFLHTNTFSDPEEKRAFLAELYEFLVKEMHTTLNDKFSFSSSQQPANIEITTEDIRRFATEAENLGLSERAAPFYQECIARNNADPVNWNKYGTFCMGVGDFRKAEECFSESISLRADDFETLMLAGIVAWKVGNIDNMKLFLEAATSFCGGASLPWLLRSLLLLVVEDIINSDMTKQQAQSRAPGTGMLGVYKSLAEFLLNTNTPSLMDKVLACVLKISPTNGCVWLTRGHHFLKQKNYVEAMKCLLEAEKEDVTLADTYVLIGHVHFEQNQQQEATKNYERASDLPTDITDEHTVRMRLGQLYMLDNKYEQAKRCYLEASSHNPTSLSWEGVGKACYHLDLLGEAEEALAESNIYDNTNATVWGFLALICIRTNRSIEAEQAYKYCRQQGLTEGDSLLADIRATQKKHNIGDPFIG